MTLVTAWKHRWMLYTSISVILGSIEIHTSKIFYLSISFGYVVIS